MTIAVYLCWPAGEGAVRGPVSPDGFAQQQPLSKVKHLYCGGRSRKVPSADWDQPFCAVRCKQPFDTWDVFGLLCLLSHSSNSAIAPDDPLIPKAAERRFCPLVKERVVLLNSWLVGGFWFMTQCYSRLLWLEVTRISACCFPSSGIVFPVSFQV